MPSCPELPNFTKECDDKIVDFITDATNCIYAELSQIVLSEPPEDDDYMEKILNLEFRALVMREESDSNLRIDKAITRLVERTFEDAVPERQYKFLFANLMVRIIERELSRPSRALQSVRRMPNLVNHATTARYVQEFVLYKQVRMRHFEGILHNFDRVAADLKVDKSEQPFKNWHDYMELMSKVRVYLNDCLACYANA